MVSVNPVTIRHASLVDVDPLIDIGVRTFNETFAHLNSAEDMEAYLSEAFTREQIESEIRDTRSTFLIAEDDGVRGYAKLHRSDPPSCVSTRPSIELARLYVGQEVYGRGVAHTLMQRMLDQSIAEGYAAMWLGVWEHNERAKAFYRKWGFREIGSHIFQLGSDPQNDVLMERVF